MPKLFSAWVEGGGENISLVYRDYTQQLYHKQLNQSRSEVNPIIRKILHAKSGFKIKSQLLAWICRLFSSRLIFYQLSRIAFFTFRDLLVCTATLIILTESAKNHYCVVRDLNFFELQFHCLPGENLKILSDFEKISPITHAFNCQNKTNHHASSLTNQGGAQTREIRSVKQCEYKTDFDLNEWKGFTNNTIQVFVSRNLDYMCRNVKAVMQQFVSTNLHVSCLNKCIRWTRILFFNFCSKL